MTKITHINSLTSKKYTTQTSLKTQQINIITGQNNSGKSRLLREITKHKESALKNQENLITKIEEIIESSINSIMPFQNQQILNSPIIKKPAGRVQAKELSQNNQNIHELIMKIRNLSKELTGMPYHPNHTHQSHSEYIKNQLNNEFIANQNQNHLIEQKIKTIYIPTIRNLRPIHSDAKYDPQNAPNHYQTRVLNDYNEELPIDNEDFDIFTGEDLYTKAHTLLCGNTRERKLLQSFEKYLADNFFTHKLITDNDKLEGVTLIPHWERDVLDIKIGESEARPIYNLGDGIQSIIILTFLAHYHKYYEQDAIFFIEEPEMYLHPGMQRKILEEWSTTFNMHQFFFTTHSNHFLDISIDFNNIAIFATSQNNKTSNVLSGNDANFEIREVPSQADTLILQELGVNPSSVCLTNSTIWVEGISERITLRHWLNIYQNHLHQEYQNKLDTNPISAKPSKSYKEDIHYTFVEYQGGNITHWSWLDEENGMNVERVCARAMVISDADGAIWDESEEQWKHPANSDPNEKINRLNKLETKLNSDTIKRFYGLPVRELENLHTIEFIQNYINENITKPDTEPFEFTKSTIQDTELWNQTAIGTIFQLDLLRHINLEAEIGTLEDTIDDLTDDDYKELTRKHNKLCPPKIDKRDNSKNKRTYYIGTPTSHHKRQIAQYTTTHYDTWSKVSPEGKRLIEAIHNFIESQNPNT